MGPTRSGYLDSTCATKSKSVSVGVPPFFSIKYEYAPALLETTSERFVAAAVVENV